MPTAPLWLKLTVAASPPVREALAALLVEWGAGGTVQEPHGVVAYFRPEAREGLEAHLARLAADARTSGEPDPTWRWEGIEEEDWWESWKIHFRPTRVSARLAVCPSWEEARWDPGDPRVRVIRMDPGRAFGTGTHETTRLCLRLLDECLAAEPAASLLDVGSGSGILSIGARLLGVPTAVAVDVDPIASEATRDNAERAGVGGILTVCGDLRAIRGRYDLVVANILYQVLLGLAPGIAARTAPGGRLLLSGMLVPELPSAEAVYGRLGLTSERREVDGEWGAVLFRKHA
ncbi:MAG: 50S ribosomal protein L11 methyltransferase [Deltaproteobacteria bacterium]|nr:50S ribosomal protein L11 methyltransferase [Deltaproteobacteria bacterium]